MEIALEPGTPIYSGGLNVVAGDTIRSALPTSAFPMIAISLVHRAPGIFGSDSMPKESQHEEADGWSRSAAPGPPAFRSAC